MKKVIRNITVAGMLILGLSFTSCKNSAEKDADQMTEQSSGEQDSHPEGGMGKMDHAGDSESISEDNQVKTTGMAAFGDKKVADLYDTYLEIKDALVATDSKAAAQAASHMVSIGNGNVTSIAKQIAESDDINVQREAFSQLTSRIEPQLKGTLASGQIYKQYCPMAFEGKGDYWLSDSEQIRNPYFGDQMLTCGRTEEIIKK
ncbi:MAG: DUF3347 domain-containing protein [Christiangramia sp.]|nr:hypothetical protein [Christiangramia sp.]|tara:strand:- start:88 stop:696 length:609 start_codon:yes stop_codon:yes gene_type:complete